MAFHVFLFLLVFFLLLCLARLWHLYLPHHTPPHSRAGTMPPQFNVSSSHAPHLIVQPAASPPLARQLWEQRLSLCVPGAR